VKEKKPEEGFKPTLNEGELNSLYEKYGIETIPKSNHRYSLSKGAPVRTFHPIKKEKKKERR